MGKLRQWIHKVWDRIGGDALWHIFTEVKRYFLGPWGVWHVLAFIASLLGGTYGALQALIHSQPTYIVVTFFVLLFAGVLIIINLLWRLWGWWKGNSSAPTMSDSKIGAEAPQSDDTLENTEQKKRFMLFARQRMNETCDCMLVTAIIAFGTLAKREENILRYSVDPYIFFTKPLRTTKDTLLNLLDEKERLSNKDFISTQNLLVELYKTYEHLRPWVRDMAWEIFEDFPATNYYKQWQKLDRDMQEELGNLLHGSKILTDRITELRLSAMRRWEKGGP